MYWITGVHSKYHETHHSFSISSREQLETELDRVQTAPSFSNVPYSCPTQQPAWLNGLSEATHLRLRLYLPGFLSSLLGSFVKLSRVQRHQICSFHRICIVVSLAHFFFLSAVSKGKLSSAFFCLDFSPGRMILLQVPTLSNVNLSMSSKHTSGGKQIKQPFQITAFRCNCRIKSAWACISAP